MTAKGEERPFGFAQGDKRRTRAITDRPYEGNEGYWERLGGLSGRFFCLRFCWRVCLICVKFIVIRYIFIDIGVVVVYTELEKSPGKVHLIRFESARARKNKSI